MDKKSIGKLRAIKSIFGVDVSIIDLDGNILGSSMDDNIYNEEIIVDDIVKSDNGVELNSNTYYHNKKFDILTKIHSSLHNDHNRILDIIDNYIVLKNIKIEKTDILKKLILSKDLDDGLEKYSDLYNNKQFILIHHNNSAGELMQIIANIYTEDMVIDIEINRTLILSDTVKSYDELCSLYDTIKAELLLEPGIITRNKISDIKALRSTYRICKEFCDRVKSKEGDRWIYSYENQILRLMIVDQKSDSLDEIVGIESYNIDEILGDRELNITIEKFLNSNLNVSEASRKLYIHRNTLVYRLNKILRLTGLDIRNFNDAITCKLLMIYNEIYKQ